MGFAIDGLSSGLDTAALIKSLMQIEAIPQALLQKKVSGTQNTINALQQLNTAIDSLGTKAKDAAKPDALNLFSATISSPIASASATTSASAASLNFTVNQVAQTQVWVTEAVTEWSGTDIIITGAGDPVEITAASNSLDDMVTAINTSESGVTALKVAAGKNGDGDDVFRLQLTSNTSGTPGAFSVSGAPGGVTQITGAENAKITLWAGSPAAQEITSTNNTFENLLPGVNVTVNANSNDPVTLTVGRDLEKSARVAEDLVGGINGVLAMISTRTAVTNSTSAAGKPVLSSGVFTGDSTVRMANEKIFSAASAPVNGFSPSSIGISISKTGSFEFDSAKFKDALAQDPTRVQSMMQTIADRVATAAKDVSDKTDGFISSKITGQESLVKSMNTQISEWDTRISTRRATLQNTFTAMEVRLSAMNSQSAWLTSQISALNPGKGKS